MRLHRPSALTLALLVALSASTTHVEAFVIVSPVGTAKGASVKTKTTVLFHPQPTSSSGTSSTELHGFFGNLLETLRTKPNNQQPQLPQKPVYETVVIDQDFRLAGLFLGLGIALDLIPYIQWTLGPIVTVLGLLFLVQTFRIRFVFDEENNFELKTALIGSELKDMESNVVVGGANKWSCDKIVNYDFFPQSWMDPDHPIGPVLVYFKETQTDSATWNEGPGKSANDPAKIAAGTAVPGQVHFFPALCNAQQIQAEFAKRGCGKIEA